MTRLSPPGDPEDFERWAATALGGVPVHDPADAGIDGVIASPERGPMLVAVKGGSRYHPRMVTDLAHTVDSLDAGGGVLIAGTAPPAEVYEAAARTGPSSGSGGVPRVQILTVTELLDGKRPEGTAD